MLADISTEVARVGRMGSFGPYLEDHLFFEGWDAWGNGVPAPLAHMTPADVVAQADVCESDESLMAKVLGTYQ
ncbi:hypothetical protein [Actinoplanes sp. GCM10030250]|uniref:hypothetical protein n=1 Tax=Actinoplanes sp. GCM10030250 TaxID=3273376 RepID=UPI00361D66C8